MRFSVCVCGGDLCIPPWLRCGRTTAADFAGEAPKLREVSTCSHEKSTEHTNREIWPTNSLTKVHTKMHMGVYTKMSTEMPTKIEDLCVKRTTGSSRRLPRECSREIFSAHENVQVQGLRATTWVRPRSARSWHDTYGAWATRPHCPKGTCHFHKIYPTQNSSLSDKELLPTHMPNDKPALKCGHLWLAFCSEQPGNPLLSACLPKPRPGRRNLALQGRIHTQQGWTSCPPRPGLMRIPSLLNCPPQGWQPRWA